MGNFLFQVAATIAYSRRHELDFTIPSSTKDSFHNPIYLQHLVSCDWDSALPSVLVNENGHAFQDIPFKEEWREKNIILNGYWQSEKYFKEYREEILDLFGYPWRMEQGLVSVHVRRGDYVHLSKKHPPVPPEWYRLCMAHFPGSTFRFFSDDIAWCKKEFSRDRNVTFASGGSIEEDLIQISHCEHHISSASTFSWWGAWLNRNPNKRVLIPNRWFTLMEEAKNDTKDIVPAEWIKI